MNKSLWLLLLVLVLLTARTEMNRPEDTVRKRPGKTLSVQDKPARPSGRVYDLNSSLSMRVSPNKR
jgi:hypothetical protein